MAGNSAVAERGAARHTHAPPAHLLFVADNERMQRAGTGAWLDRELARGAKVYYKGWIDPGTTIDRHWLAGPAGPRRGREAVASGQLEFCDFPTVIEHCGGTTAGLRRLQADEVSRAMDEGWPAVAMTQESAQRPMADDAEAAEFAVQERGYDELIRDWPLRVLCQLVTPAENDAAIWESAAVHHEWLVDGPWSATGPVDESAAPRRMPGVRWSVRGELDAWVARRFGGALAGALRRARESAAGPHLHVDLSEVTFMDVACARMLTLAARSMPSGQEVRAHGASRTVRRLLDAVERPRTLLVDDEGDVQRDIPAERA